MLYSVTVVLSPLSSVVSSVLTSTVRMLPSLLLLSIVMTVPSAKGAGKVKESGAWMGVRRSVMMASVELLAVTSTVVVTVPSSSVTVLVTIPSTSLE